MSVQSHPKTMLDTAWKILVIDDDEDDYLIARDMLKEAKGRKIDVHWANNYAAGREALFSDQYNAVLVDYDLGNHSGIELIREVNEQGYPAPLILFTGRGNYEVDVEAMAAGATLYLTKSEVNPLLLERAIRYAVELKQKEQALRESEARERAKAAEVNAILDAVPAIVWITHDTQAQEVTGNQAAHDFLRVPIGKNLSKSAPRGAPRNFKVYQDGRELAPEDLPLQITAATGRQIRNFEEEVIFEDGDHGHLLGNVTPLLAEDGKPRGAVAAFINITERKQVEQALRLSEERFYRAFDANPNAQVISRLVDGRIESINEGFGQMFGYQPDEVLGKTSLELNMFAHPADRDEATRRLRASGRLRDFELAIRTKSGEIRQASLSVEMMSIDGERFMLTVIQDITKRKQMEEKLRISEERYRVAIINAPAVYAQTDRHLRYQWIHNPPPDFRARDVIGKRDDELEDSEDMRRLVARKQQVFESGVGLREELNFHHSDGVRTYDLTIEPLRDPDGQIVGVSTAAFDITECKRAELASQRALAQAEQGQLLLEALLENIPEGISITGGPPDFQLEHISRYGRQLTRNPVNPDLLGKPAGEHQSTWGIFLADGETLPSKEQMPLYRASHFGETVRNEEMVIWLQNGDRIPILVNAAPIRDGQGQITAAINSWRDITEIKQAEAELRASEERFRQLADAMPQLVWMAKADGTVDYYNLRYREYNGIAPGEDGNWEWAPVLHPDDLQPTVDSWAHAVGTGEGYQIEHRIRMRDGSFRWHLSRSIPVKDEAGHVIRWFGTATDIDDQKRNEVRIQRSNQELEQFAFIASHDLQEPLRKIIQFGDRLRRHLSDTPDETAEDYMGRMQHAAKRMQTMINGLLDLSRVNARGGAFATVHLTQVVKEAISDLEARIQAAHGQVKMDELPTLEADEMQMRQLFQNLIGNAIKFHRSDTPPVVHVSGKIINQNRPPIVEIQVVDNGIGFEQQYAERIFQPFQRLQSRNEYEGTGLGLAICQKIVERHHGTMAVQSAPNEGTTFIIHLPLQQPL